MNKLALVLILASTPAQACHKFSIWHYPYPQKCPIVAQHHHVIALAQERPRPAHPHSKRDDIEIPLPSLEKVEQPDASGPDWDRLKGMGMLQRLQEDK